MRNYSVERCDVHCEEDSVGSRRQIRQALEDACCVFNVTGQVLYNRLKDRINKSEDEVSGAGDGGVE